jgi:aspartate-semialdehyde dehydrogenase
MKQFRVGLVGIGAVGTEMIKVLRQRRFPASEIRILARSERDETVAGESFHVRATTPEAFDGLDIALFAGTEGSKGASRLYGWEAVKRGCVVIDNGDDFRMDARVPLVVPEINGDALASHEGFIANPNCSTIITLMGLAPLHRAVPIERFTAVTFQSVSGTGRDAIDELDRQARAWAAGAPVEHTVYPRQIFLNVLPQIGGFKAELPGYTSEEAKLLFESRKILNAPALRVATTCVRVPVFYAHSVALHVKFSGPMTPERAREILGAAPGVRVRDDMAQRAFPTPLDVQHGDDVHVGRIRHDPSEENGLALWVVGDNIRKGAAQNAVQIAEELIRRGLLGKR